MKALRLVYRPDAVTHQRVPARLDAMDGKRALVALFVDDRGNAVSSHGSASQVDGCVIDEVVILARPLGRPAEDPRRARWRRRFSVVRVPRVGGDVLPPLGGVRTTRCGG